MSQRQSSRGAHRRVRQLRMDLEATFVIPDAKQERIKDEVYTLFDDDFSVPTKAIKDWILESAEALRSYYLRPVKADEVLRKKMGFLDGIKYFRTILISELTADQGKSLEDLIMEDLGKLVITCPECTEHIYKEENND